MTTVEVNPERVVLLDRDGTVIVQKHYLSDPEEVELIPGAIEGLRELMGMGLRLVIVTNQSAINRGYLTEERLQEINRRMVDDLAKGGVELAGIYYCPHRPDENCDCRKPRPGLVARAARELGFDPAKSFMIGDNLSDVELGKNIGATTFLVRTGYGREIEAEHEIPDISIVDDLRSALPAIRKVIESHRDGGGE